MAVEVNQPNIMVCGLDHGRCTLCTGSPTGCIATELPDGTFYSTFGGTKPPTRARACAACDAQGYNRHPISEFETDTFDCEECDGHGYVPVAGDVARGAA